MHRGAGNEDGAFERVSALARELIGDGGQELVERAHRRAANIEQRKTAGAIGRFHHAGLETALADGRSLLIAGNASDRNRRAE